MKTRLGCFTSMIFLALASMAAGCGGDDSSTGATGSGGSSGSGGSAGAGGSSGGGGSAGGDASDMKIASSMGDWNVYRNPYGDGGANPAENVKGSADAFATAKGMRVVLTVSGLTASRPFGSHVHKLACDNMSAGGHYQDNPAPDGGATNPMYANPTNEVWLDFVTDAMGAATKTTEVDFVPRKGEANAIVIHDMTTMDGGIAGPKLACINIPF